MTTIIRLKKQLLCCVPGVGGRAGLFLALLLLSGCVKDTIYHTNHPDKAQVSISTKWNDIGSGITKPSTYIVSSEAIQEEVKGDTHTFANLFDPGQHTFYIYNLPTGITVDKGVASVAISREETVSEGMENIINPLPGWFFTGTLDAVLEQDTKPGFDVAMHQQTRQLTLLLAPDGPAADRITGINGYLSGAAGELNISGDTHSKPSRVALEFTPVTEGTDAGKWSATVRLLGIAGEGQKLIIHVSLAGETEVVSIEIDAAEELSGFNENKKTPLTLNTRFTIDKTQVTVVTDWSDRGTEVQIPSVYIISTTGMEEVAYGESHLVQNLFAPGTYPFHLYNEIPEINVTNGIATVNTQEKNYIHPAPGWFFTGFAEATLNGEPEYELRTTMHQQLRQLTFILKIQGNGADLIENISGTFKGAAGELQISDGLHSKPSDINLLFNKMTEGANAGKWTETVRLLGIAGVEQQLNGTIRLTDGREFALQSDLSDDLIAFNKNKKSPLALQAEVTVEVQVEAGFTATIKDWEKVDGGSGTAQ